MRVNCDVWFVCQIWRAILSKLSYWNVKLCERKKLYTSIVMWWDFIENKLNWNEQRKSRKKLLADAFGRRFDACQLIEKPYSSRCSTELRNEIIFSIEYHPIIHQSCSPEKTYFRFDSTIRRWTIQKCDVLPIENLRILNFDCNSINVVSII